MSEETDDRPPPEDSLALDMQEVALRALVSGMAGRDEADLAALYDATAGRLFAVSRRIVGETAGAEEVLADAYLQAWEQAGRYDPSRGNVMHWLYAICRTRALDYVRRRESRLDTEREAGARGSRPQHGSEDPAEILMGIQNTTLLYKALKVLEPAHRQLIALAFFRDLSHQEISERTGIPLGTVKSAIKRSFLRLREALQQVGAMGASYG